MDLFISKRTRHCLWGLIRMAPYFLVYLTVSSFLFVQWMRSRSRIKELESILRVSSDVCDKAQYMLRDKRKEADAYHGEVILLRDILESGSEEELKEFQERLKGLKEQKEILKDILPHLNLFGTIPYLSDEGFEILKKHIDFETEEDKTKCQ